MGKAVKHSKDRAYRGSQRRLRKQKATDALRKKYGPTEKPAPVIIRSLETGEIIKPAPLTRKPAYEGRYSAKLDQIARLAGFQSYAAYLESAHWRNLRRRVLRRDNNRCIQCGSTSALTVHHDRYTGLSTKNIEFLKTLCWPCHRKIHRKQSP